jgi:hypothetical protein
MLQSWTRHMNYFLSGRKEKRKIMAVNDDDDDDLVQHITGSKVKQHEKQQDEIIIDELSVIDIHEECRKQSDSSIISKYIQRYPEALAKTDDRGNLPLHVLIWNASSSTAIDDALVMIEKYPAALQHPNESGELPIHLECSNPCRPAIISKCIELYPEGLANIGQYGYLPLHLVLYHNLPPIDVVGIIEKYPEALKHQNEDGYLPLHIECHSSCRSSIILKCIELYPEAVAVADKERYMPLHRLLLNGLSTVEDTLMMIEKYPAALQHYNSDGYLPLHIECHHLCRSAIISKCIGLHPEAFDDRAIANVIRKLDKRNFHQYSSVLSIIFTAYPMGLYDYPIYIRDDIRNDAYTRRRILNLLPRHVFTPTHDADYRHLNWQPRAAMILLLSQIKIQQLCSQQ